MKHNKQRLEDVIWNSPSIVLNMTFKQNKGNWESEERPDHCEKTKKVHTVLKRHNGSIKVFNNSEYNAGASLDIWELIQRIYNCTFSEALDKAAEAYGIEPLYESDADRAAYAKQKTRKKMINEAAAYLCDCLTKPEGEGAREYLASRGLKPSKRLGAISNDIQNHLADHLKGLHSDVTQQEVSQFIKEYFPCNPDAYKLVIPFYNGDTNCKGFTLRRTSKNEELNKYMYSTGMSRGCGCCSSLKPNKPAILVEGILDREAVMQAAEGADSTFSFMTNVVALGGQTPTFSPAEPQKSSIATLKRYGITKVIYVPDFECEDNGEPKTEATARTIAALREHMRTPYLGDNDKGFFTSITIADLSILDQPDIKDIDDFLHANGGGVSRLKDRLEQAVPWYEWELHQAVKVAADARELAAKVQTIYTSINDYAEREMLRRRLTAAPDDTDLGKIKNAGVTANVLQYIDRDSGAADVRTKIGELSAKLEEAVKTAAPIPTMIDITTKALHTLNYESAQSFTSQMSANVSTFLSKVQQNPPYLDTEWQMYKEMKDGKIIKDRIMSFSPAAVSVIAAPTNHGKTLVMLQSCINLARSTHKRFIYLSTENDQEQLFIRSLACYIGQGWHNGSDKQKRSPRKAIREYIQSLPSVSLLAEDDIKRILSNEEGVNIWKAIQSYSIEVQPFVKLARLGNDIDIIGSNIKAQCDAWANNGEEVGGVFIDYLQQLRSSTRSYSRIDELKYVTDALNELAKSIHCPVICAAQFNRSATKSDGFEGITLANIGEGASIENIAEDAYLLYNTNKLADDVIADRADLNGKRYKRCLDNSLNLKKDCIYIETLKARDFASGSFALLSADNAAGAVTGQYDFKQQREIKPSKEQILDTAEDVDDLPY